MPSPRARLGKGTPCGAIPGTEQLEEVAELLLLFTLIQLTSSPVPREHELGRGEGIAGR